MRVLTESVSRFQTSEWLEMLSAWPLLFVTSTWPKRQKLKPKGAFVLMV